MPNSKINPNVESIGSEDFYVAYKAFPENLINPRTKKTIEFGRYYTLKDSKKLGDSKIYGFTLSHHPIEALNNGQRVFKCLIPLGKKDSIRKYTEKMIVSMVPKFYLTNEEIDFNEVWEHSGQKSYSLCASKSNFNPHLVWNELDDLHILNLCSSGNKNFNPHLVWDQLHEGQVNNLCHSNNPSFYPHKVWDELNENHKFALCLRGHPNFEPHEVWKELAPEQKNEIIRRMGDNFHPFKIWSLLNIKNKKRVLINSLKRSLRNSLISVADKMKIK